MVLKDFPFNADATEPVCTAPLFQEMEHYHHMFFTLLSSNQISLHPKELPQRNIPRASQVRNLDHWLAVSRLTACSSVLIYTSLTPLNSLSQTEEPVGSADILQKRDLYLSP